MRPSLRPPARSPPAFGSTTAAGSASSGTALGAAGPPGACRDGPDLDGRVGVHVLVPADLQAIGLDGEGWLRSACAPRTRRWSARVAGSPCRCPTGMPPVRPRILPLATDRRLERLGERGDVAASAEHARCRSRGTSPGWLNRRLARPSSSTKQPIDSAALPDSMPGLPGVRSRRPSPGRTGACATRTRTAHRQVAAGSSSGAGCGPNRGGSRPPRWCP